MPEIFGQAFWPGVSGFISCTYTCSQGISPGIASLEIPEQDVSKIQGFGSLVITDGSFAVRLNRCRVVDIAFRGGGGGGRSIILSIADRRWMWQFGYISGNWNVIDPYPDADQFPDGEFVAQGGPYAPGTYRLAVNLMQDCFRAMNETAAAIAPAPAVPVAVSWENENPAAALQQVCDAVGYRVAYQPIKDRVLVSPSGVGKTLTGLFPIITDSASVNLPTRPATIKLVGGNTVYQDYVALEPVGLEKNGQIKHIDDLSYAPKQNGDDNNFEDCAPSTFPTVVGGLGLSEAEAKDMAKRYVWRTFRVKMGDVSDVRFGRILPGPVNVAGYGPVRDRKQIVLGGQVYETSKNAQGQYETEPAWIIGNVYVPPCDFKLPFGLTMAGTNTDHTTGIRLPHRPVVDTARGLVTFDRQLFQYDDTNVKWNTPLILLYTSMQIRSEVGQVPSRFEWGGTLAGVPDLGCPPEIIRHPELGAVFRAVRRDRDKALVTVASNLDDIIPPAEYFLNAANAKYNADVATDRTYAGVVPIEPNGAIQQVTWSVGGGQPATTRASRNTEHSTYLPSYPERRRNETFRMLAARLNGSASSVPAKSMNPPPPGAWGSFPLQDGE